MPSAGSSPASGSASPSIPAARNSPDAAGSVRRISSSFQPASSTAVDVTNGRNDIAATTATSHHAETSTHATSSAEPPAPLTGKRSRSGCLTCRKRKKKCDETLCEETGGCWRCRNAGYQCEGFRRPPVVFEPGSASNSKHKRTRGSPDAHLDQTRNRVKLEGGSHADVNGIVDPRSAAHEHGSFSTVGPGAQTHRTSHGSLDPQGLDMANSLAQFAGLATSSAAWPLESESKGGTLSSYPPFAHPSTMVTTSSQASQPTTQQSHDHSPTQHQHQQHQSLAPISLRSPAAACEIVGDCLFSGHHLCASCSAVANRLMQPDPAQLAALDADLVQVQPMPSLSTPMASRHHSPEASNANTSSHAATAKSRLVMESLIGYYSTLITCWVQGCDVRGIENSTLFRQLVPYLLDSVDRHTPLRLSIAAVTAGYVGGARLTWPKDVVAIHQWANTLRADRTSIADCVKANLNFSFPGTPDTIWTGSPAGSLSSEPLSALSPANAERLKRASTTHATLDDLLVGQAQTLKQLSVRSLEQAVSDYCAKTTRAMGVSFTEKGFLAECVRVNPLLMAALNIAIYAFAEEGMQSYFEEAARMRGLIETLLGSFPPVDLGKLTSHEHLGFRTYVWSDVTTAIACGTRPHLQLAMSTYTTEHEEGERGDLEKGEDRFGLADVTLIALSDIARLRYDFDGGDFSYTARRSAGSPVPQWVHERARRIQTRAESCTIDTPLTTGSAICAVLTKSACIILIHTLIYRVGALHPVVRGLLRGMLELWTSAGEAYCRSVGCSNFNLPMFVAASVAVDEADRRVCDQAMRVVGHEEAGPASGRELVREVWRRSDVTGTPVFWTDLIAGGDFAVAFF
ncbi:Zn(2)-C6 fungal-type domain-containing protein [Pseudozyma hubeiensis]|nr:Zn(2)-C6 fungal-type domain-containing protein [Pseudozyma hubeiensis]